jgi:predicted Ser/Thr protein kinase
MKHLSKKALESLSVQSITSCLLFYYLIIYLQFVPHKIMCLPQLNHVDTQQAYVTQTTATLCEARWRLAATSAGELVFFGGGSNATVPSNRVDICNVTSGNWTTATLSVPRRTASATSSGTLVFFAGGYNLSATLGQVDIYNISDGNWSTATLSQNRTFLAATSIGSLVLFGGGNDLTSDYNVVDIYNVTNNAWTTATLSQARSQLAAISVAHRYALFAGGQNGTMSSIIDIYDSLNGYWSNATLSQARCCLAATSLGSLAFFGGGENSNNQASSVIDIFNATTLTWNTATLSQARYWLAAAAIGDIVAFGGGTFDGTSSSLSVVDMYSMTSNMWFTATLSQPRDSLAATSSTNFIFFGGGENEGTSSYSNVVDIFEISSFLTPSSLKLPTYFPQSLSTLSVSSTPSLFSNSSTPISYVPNARTLANTSQTNFAGQNMGTHTGSNGVVIGIVVGIVALLAGTGLILFLLLFLKKRKQKKKRERNNEDDTTAEQRKGTVVIENDTSNITSDETNMATMTITMTCQPGTETLKSLTPGQIPFNELEIGKVVGEGTYGRVCLGKWKQYRVALKFCQNKGKRDEFMREVNLMISLPPHPNVVRMYGVSIDGAQPIIVMEYCAGGSLDNVLFDRSDYISQEQKIRLVHDIALGMRHLHKHNIVHRDLAARNILLSHPNLNDAQLRVSDFGMSRVLQQDVEGKTLNVVGPIRWMAPESIRDQVYSKKSDVWMFGILVYEIVARHEPHVDIDPNQVLILIRDRGLTPKIPHDCPPILRELMEMCWKKYPEQRPSFDAIIAMLNN